MGHLLFLNFKKNDDNFIFRYLPALKIVEDLEYNYTNQMHKYRFMNEFSKALKPLRDQIREQSYSELTDFLENLMVLKSRS